MLGAVAVAVIAEDDLETAEKKNRVHLVPAVHYGIKKQRNYFTFHFLFLINFFLLQLRLPILTIRLIHRTPPTLPIVSG